MASETEVKQRLVDCLREMLRLAPHSVRNSRAWARRAVQESPLSYEQYLGELAEQGVPDSADESNRALASRVGLARVEKGLARFDMKRLPPKVARQVRTLLDGRVRRRS